MRFDGVKPRSNAFRPPRMPDGSRWPDTDAPLLELADRFGGQPVDVRFFEDRWRYGNGGGSPLTVLLEDGLVRRLNWLDGGPAYELTAAGRAVVKDLRAKA